MVEYPLAMVLACLAAPGTEKRRRGAQLGKVRLGDVLFAGVVFVLTATLVTNQAGLAEIPRWVCWAVMVAAGLGILACVTARRRPIRFALVVASVLTAGALAPGPQRPVAPYRAQFLRCRARDS